MITTFAQVALGGAIGAMLRFGVGLVVMRAVASSFPLGVLLVNVVGSFAMGFFAVYSFHRGLQHLNPFVMTGVLGGFTTFSAFSLEAFTLYERGQITAAGLYVALSVVLSLVGLGIGVMIARGLWA
ncbi:MAG: fluoride efflux transporter CrcB [Alphaproteobacteria bacterium]|jgi:CrcB protein|nr:fluoride efflux transporter CrcB [Alphaproteobacteria bacterium]